MINPVKETPPFYDTFFSSNLRKGHREQLFFTDIQTRLWYMRMALTKKSQPHHWYFTVQVNKTFSNLYSNLQEMKDNIMIYSMTIVFYHNHSIQRQCSKVRNDIVQKRNNLCVFTIKKCHANYLQISLTTGFCSGWLLYVCFRYL